MIAVLCLLGTLATIMSVVADGGILCQDATFDAIVTLSNKNTYVFKGTQYWKLANGDVASGYPRSISSDWGGLPSHLDAAFTWKNGDTYFFKGNNYWRYRDMNPYSGYPRVISDGFSRIPNNIDAAFVWGANKKIYFFKGSQYWRFDPSDSPPIPIRYPMVTTRFWEGVPDNLDDILHYSNGNSYFFKDGHYWRYNDIEDKVDRYFPRSTGIWWFGCSPSGRNL